MHLSHEEYIEKQRRKVVELLTQVIAGKISILLAARQIVQLRSEIGIDENDEDILVFAGIDSESDSLPIGPEKAYWDEKALKKKEKEIVLTEEWALGFGIKACESLKEKLDLKKSHNMTNAPDRKNLRGLS